MLGELLSGSGWDRKRLWERPYLLFKQTWISWERLWRHQERGNLPLLPLPTLSSLENGYFFYFRIVVSQGKVVYKYKKQKLLRYVNLGEDCLIDVKNLHGVFVGIKRKNIIRLDFRRWTT